MGTGGASVDLTLPLNAFFRDANDDFLVKDDVNEVWDECAADTRVGVKAADGAWNENAESSDATESPLA